MRFEKSECHHAGILSFVGLLIFSSAFYTVGWSQAYAFFLGAGYGLLSYILWRFTTSQFGSILEVILDYEHATYQLTFRTAVASLFLPAIFAAVLMVGGLLLAPIGLLAWGYQPKTAP